SRSIHRRHLPPFPTRRSSDLRPGTAARRRAAATAVLSRLLEPRVLLSPALLQPLVVLLRAGCVQPVDLWRVVLVQLRLVRPVPRSEEHTSELQSRENLVCRLL